VSDLESIVRPSQTLDFAPAKTYYQPGQASVPNTMLRIGRYGQGKTFSGSGSYTSSHYMTQYVNEKSDI
jgi:hypothetical protein